MPLFRRKINFILFSTSQQTTVSPGSCSSENRARIRQEGFAFEIKLMFFGGCSPHSLNFHFLDFHTLSADNISSSFWKRGDFVQVFFSNRLRCCNNFCSEIISKKKG